MSITQKILMGLLTCALLAGLWYSYVMAIPRVAVTQVVRGSAVELVYATGTVEPAVQATVSPEVNGRIAEFYAQENDIVNLGGPLARLFDAEQYAEVSELMIRVANEETALRRDEDLLKRKVGSREEYDNSKSALEQSKARLAAAQVRLQQRTLRSPISGVVLRRDHEIGETVTPGMRLFVVGQLKPLRVTMEIDEEDIPRVQIGQKVLLSNDAFPEQVFTAAVSEITPLGDSSSKTYRVRAQLPEETVLPVGMSVEANVVLTERTNALLIPATAMQDSHVYLVGSDHRVKKVSIKVGLSGIENIEVIQGLSDGDLIVRGPSVDLRDGQRVKVRREP